MKKVFEKMGRFLTKDNVENYYILKHDLGKGTFSVVKLGVNKKTGEEVAIKVIDKKRVGQKKDMIENEVAILRQVDSPFIIELKELFETTTHLYLVMELVTGGELFDSIVTRGSFSENDTCRIVWQILEGVKYLHELGIAHRDLKPENLLLATNKPDSGIKIADFGLSKIMSEEAQFTMQTACGTPGYVAPEVLKCEGYGKAVDLWSVGVVLYILLCGFPPFYDENNSRLFEKIMNGQFCFPDPYWSHISENAKDLIRKLLTVDPELRPDAQQALLHPWFTSKKDSNHNPNAMEKLKEFNSSRKEMKRTLDMPFDVEK